MAKLLTTEEVVELVRRSVEAAGGQLAFAQRVGVSQPYVSDVLSGSRRPGKAFLAAVGFERVVLHREIT